MRYCFWMLVLVLVLAACGTPTPAQQPTSNPTESPWRLGTPEPLFAPLDATCAGAQPFPPRTDTVQYGSNVFLFATDRARVLSLTRIAGYTWIRQQVHWRDLEGERGQYVWTPLDQIVTAARANNLHIMVSVVRSPTWATSNGDDGLPDDPATFARFMSAVATRYAGRVAAYQLWNEPNLAHENGGTPATPAAYLATLQAGYAAVKQADPCALVVSAALAATVNPDPAVATDDLPFFEQLYQLDDGAFLRSADIVAMHTGAGANPPAADWQNPDASPQYFRHLERSRAIMEQYNDPRQVWLTEYGWTNREVVGAAPPVSASEQATYLVDATWYARQRYPWLTGMFLWNLNFSIIAPPDDEKTAYSVLADDWQVSPAFIALQNNIPALQQADHRFTLPAAAARRHAWTFPARGALRVPLRVGNDGTLYAVSAPGTLYAVNPDGSLRWQFNAPGSLSAPPAITADGTLLLNDSGSILSAVNPDGSLRWQQQLPRLQRGSPLWLSTPSLIIVTGIDGTIAAYTADGNEQWTFALNSEAAPAIATPDGHIVVLDARGRITQLDATGQQVWQVQQAGTFWAPPSPAPDGGLYATTTAGRVFALDAAGNQQWSQPLELPVQLPVELSPDASTLYVTATNGTLVALDSTTGNERWRVTVNSTLTTPPAPAPDGTLYLSTGDGLLLALDSRDGRTVWQHDVRSPATPFVTATDTLLLPTGGGNLHALETANGDAQP